MEKAIIINNQTNLSKLSKFNRFYIGAEFCQNLLPSTDQIKKLFTNLKDKTIPISLITPIVTDIGIKKIDNLLAFLTNQKYNVDEIIINDFGVLNLIHRKYPIFQPIIGRLLSPQLLPIEIETSPRSIYSIRFLEKEYGIQRIEMDNYNNNMKIDVPKSLKKIHFSIYTPYLYVTTTRRCLFPHLLSSKPKKYEKFRCHQECLNLKQDFIIKYPIVKERFYINKNTYFIKRKKISKNLKMNIDRIVYDYL